MMGPQSDSPSQSQSSEQEGQLKFISGRDKFIESLQY